MVNLYAVNTLRFKPELCNNCGMCSIVCPHGVFAAGRDAAELVNPEACMECGACQKNCPTGAVTVDSGVGCAAAMIMAALTGQKEACCGPRDPSDADLPQSRESVCCGSDGTDVSLDETAASKAESQSQSCSGPADSESRPAAKSQASSCCGSSQKTGKAQPN